MRTFTNPKKDCPCVRVPEDVSMMFIAPNGKLIDVMHQDCPEHGIIRHYAEEEDETDETEEGIAAISNQAEGSSSEV